MARRIGILRSFRLNPRDAVLSFILIFLALDRGVPLALGATGDSEDEAVSAAVQLGTGFTYQGRLERDGAPEEGTFDFELRLWDDGSAGLQLGPTLTRTAEPRDGLFSLSLDFGEVFDGKVRWIEVSVREPGGGTFESLGRQKLTATPYALFASSAPWEGISGVPASFADDIDNDTTYSAGPGLDLAGTEFAVEFAGDGAALTAARSDHDHFGQSWSGSQASPGLSVANAAGSGIAGQSTVNGAGIAGVSGVGSGTGCTNADSGNLASFCVGVRGVATSGAAGIGVLGQGSRWAGYFDGDVLVEEHLTVFTGCSGCGSSISDARLKRDIAPGIYGLESVLQMEPVTFVYDDPQLPGTRLGFLAQDMQKVVPEIVNEGSDGYLRLDYNGITPVLVRAIQEQQEQIDELKRAPNTGTDSPPFTPGGIQLGTIALVLVMLAGVAGFLGARLGRSLTRGELAD